MKKIYKVLSIFFIILFSFLFIPVEKITAHAESENYNNTIYNELIKVNNFNSNYYLENQNNLGLEFITILEANQKLYVYIFCGDKFQKIDSIKSINISREVGENLSYTKYELKLIASELNFKKYLVKNLTVYSTKVRYYDISSIFTTISEDINVTEKANEIGTRFKFETKIDGTTEVSRIDTEVITITNKYCGFIRYEGGIPMVSEDTCERYFIAFSTDRTIDKLKEVDIYYTSQTLVLQAYGSPANNNYKTLKPNVESISSGFLWLKTYVWNDIETISQFVQNIGVNKAYNLYLTDLSDGSEITSTLPSELQGMDYVVNFEIVSYKSTSGSSAGGIMSKERIFEVSILRLKFETDGVTYNLGVIDDVTKVDSKPLYTIGYGVGMGINNLEDLLKLILGVLAIILLLVILGPVLPVIINLIVLLLKSILKIISMPFKVANKGKRKLR